MLISFSEPSTLIGAAAIILQICLAVGVILRVMLTRHPPGSSFAWILITVILPYVGFILYLFFGEKTVGRWHARKLRQAQRKRHKIFRHIAHSEAKAPLNYRPISKLATRLGKFPLTDDSSLRLLDDTDETLTRLVSDINAAKESIVMEFYIWDVGGKADDVSAALIRAARRGVQCYVIVDDIGSSRFIKSEWFPMFQHEGIHIERALPVSLFSAIFARADIRLHRKIVVIDYRIAYSGSLNLADPHFFKKDSHLGQWVDAMVRAKGEIVSSLYHLIMFDWLVLTNSEKPFPSFPNRPLFYDEQDRATVSIVPSGPGTTEEANQRIILEVIHCAKKSIEIVTPYFVPGESLALALQNAAQKGVQVKIILPKKTDSPLVTYASRRYFEDLLRSGVRIKEYESGMLHTKALVIDGDLSLFGTVNMDNRSMHINYELMLLVFDREFGQKVQKMMTNYEATSSDIRLSEWHKRSLWERTKEGASFLVSPLL